MRKLLYLPKFLAVLVACAFANHAGAEEYEFKFHHLMSPKSPLHAQILTPWADRVRENSGGRVNIEIYPSMSLGGKPPELLQQVRDGVVDLVWHVNGYTPGMFPRTEVFELPGVFRNSARAANLAMYDMFQGSLKEEYAGVEVMWLHVHGGQGIMMTEKEVRKPGDLAGMKMRIPSRTGAWVLEELGAVPIAMPVPAIPNALSKNVVDGTLLPWEIIPPLRLQNQISYFVEGHDSTRFGSTTFQVSMNKARWDGLPDDIKKAFRDASGREWWGEIGDIYTDADAFGIRLALDDGQTHISLSKEDTEAFLKELEPVVDRWIEDVNSKGIDGTALVKQARDLISQNVQ